MCVCKSALDSRRRSRIDFSLLRYSRSLLTHTHVHEQVLLRTADGHVTAWVPAEESDFDVDGRYAASFSESVSVCACACVKRVVRA